MKVISTLGLLHAKQMADQLLTSNYVQIQEASSFAIPPGWQLYDTQDNLDNHQTVVTFALHNQNTEWLRKKFENVNDPHHMEHENFLTMKEIAQMTSPHSDHKKMVVEYVKSLPGAAITHVSAHENFITISLPVSSANMYFRTRLAPFVHRESGRVVLRSTQGFAIPQQLTQAVSTLIGLHHFPHYGKKFNMIKEKATDGYDTTPQAIWKRYNITLPTSTSTKNKQAIASFLGQYFSPSDLTQFQHTFNLPNQQPSLVGPNDPTNPGTEAGLDIQYVSIGKVCMFHS